MKSEGLDISIFNESEDHIIYDLLFHEHFPYFEGHFNGFKILAALIQIQLVVEKAKQKFGQEFYPKQIPNMKFVKPIFPRHKIQLEIQLKQDKNAVMFRYFYEDTVYSQGQYKI